MQRTLIGISIALAIVASAARAAEPKALTASSGVEEILSALHAVGQGLEGFSADVKLSEISNATGDASARSGKVLFQNKGEGDARLRIVFDSKSEGSAVRKERLEFLLDGGWLIERDHKRRIEINRQVLRPGQKVNLLKLGEGPFPLPIGQAPKDVQAQFQVNKIEPGKEDPPQTVHLRLVPRGGTGLARKFAGIDVWVDLKTHMPVRIDTEDARGSDISRSTELSNVRVNPQPPLVEGDFKLPTLEEGWQKHHQPFSD